MVVTLAVARLTAAVSGQKPRKVSKDYGVYGGVRYSHGLIWNETMCDLFLCKLVDLVGKHSDGFRRNRVNSGRNA